MSERGSMVVFVAGLILTMAGVGGVEHSLTNDQLISSLLVSVLGLMAMGAAILGLRQING